MNIYPLAGDTQKMSDSPLECILNRSWRPTLTVTGITGFPSAENAGNVLVPFCEARFSLRMPPTLDGERAVAELTKILTENPPYNCKAQLSNVRSAKGWNAKDYDKFLGESISSASKTYF